MGSQRGSGTGGEDKGLRFPAGLFQNNIDASGRPSLGYGNREYLLLTVLVYEAHRPHGLGLGPLKNNVSHQAFFRRAWIFPLFSCGLPSRGTAAILPPRARECSASRNAAYLFPPGLSFSVVGPPRQPSRLSESDPTTALKAPVPAASPVPASRGSSLFCVVPSHTL